jgi:hypothetical protein
VGGHREVNRVTSFQSEGAMRFALIGPHPDGLNLAKALSAHGGALVAVNDAVRPDFAPEAKAYVDLEELLADPAVELIIVAGALGVRADQLRRGLQSERDVVCVHPCDAKPDRAYEAALIQSEVKRVLLPVLPGALHPAISELQELIRAGHFGPDGPQLLQWQGPRSIAEAGALFEHWTILRRIGGEVAEVSGFAAGPAPTAHEPLLFSGRFEKSGVFQITLLPRLDAEADLKLTAARGEAELLGPDQSGRATLRWRRTGCQVQEQTWADWDRWAALADLVKSTLAQPAQPQPLTWQDEIRMLELDDALQRSIEKRRSSDLEYQEISADTGSKGTLTLIGCGMIWLILLIFAASIWVPWIRWAVVPLLVGFLLLLGMKWLAGPKNNGK